MSFTDAKINEYKKKHPEGVHMIEVVMDEDGKDVANALLRHPDLDTVLASNDLHPESIIRQGFMILDNCWLEGDNRIKENPEAKALFEQANEILGFRITDIMFEGSEEELKQTKVTQPAIFLHSVVLAKTTPDFAPDMVAGHSLGEFSALVANGTLAFEDGLKLVYQRAMAMQEACEINPSTMAAILGLADEKVEEICAEITDEIVVAANYNCPGQLVISGSNKGIEVACEKMKAAGAKRALPLPVGGAFHSPLMEPAREKLQKAIESTQFNTPICPVYQNVSTTAVST